MKKSYLQSSSSKRPYYKLQELANKHDRTLEDMQFAEFRMNYILEQDFYKMVLRSNFDEDDYYYVRFKSLKALKRIYEDELTTSRANKWSEDNYSFIKESLKDIDRAIDKIPPFFKEWNGVTMTTM